MASPVCNGNPDRVVWCHSNFSEHGKGVGLKAHDIFGFYGCDACHDWFDRASRTTLTPDERREWFYRAFSKSLLVLLELGVLR